MSKFVKSEIVEATQWFKNGDHPEDDSAVFHSEGRDLIREGKIVRYFQNPGFDENEKCPKCLSIMHDHGWIDDGECGSIVCPGEWVITGVDGKHYPCNPEVFEEMYDGLTETTEDKRWVSALALALPEPVYKSVRQYIDALYAKVEDGIDKPLPYGGSISDKRWADDQLHYPKMDLLFGL